MPLKTTKSGASSTTISTISCFKYNMRISIARIPNTKDWAKEEKKKKNLFCLPHYTILCPMLNHKTLKNLHPWYTYIHINIIFADLIYPTPNYKNKNEPKMKREWRNHGTTDTAFANSDSYVYSYASTLLLPRISSQWSAMHITKMLLQATASSRAF